MNSKISNLQKESKTISVAFYLERLNTDNNQAVDVDCHPSGIIWKNLLQSLTMKGYIHWTEHIGQVAVLA